MSGILLYDLEWVTILAIVLITLITSSIHGATGVAGGFLLSAAIAPVIGIKPIVPVISIALLISHSSRAILNAGHFNKKAFFAISLPAIPCIIGAALVYGRMSSDTIAFILGSVILCSIPIRRWAIKRKVQTSTRMLSTVGTAYGALSGISIGPGMLLTPFMLGYGLSREAFVATLAVIALATNVTRVSVYGATGLLDERYFLLGILIGVVTIPGNWIGRSILRRITNEHHAGFVDILTVIGALNFFWLALR